MQTQLGIPYSPNFPAARLLDLFLPDRPNGAAILFLHGGGWKGGARAQWHSLAQYFTQRGYTCASADYRLVPQALFPAQIEDARLAMACLKLRARDLGFDARRVAALGSSAGGHLVALLATTPPGDPLGLTAELAALGPPDTRPDAAICYCAVTTLHDADFGPPGPDDLIHALMGRPEADAPDLYRAGSPIDRVTGREPPIILIHGDADDLVPAAHSAAMHRRLVEAGARSRLVVLPGVGHGFGYGTETPERRAAIAAAEAFLAEAFSPERG
jgi:acetyl esterase/lipase